MTTFIERRSAYGLRIGDVVQYEGRERIVAHVQGRPGGTALVHFIRERAPKSSTCVFLGPEDRITVVLVQLELGA